MSLIPKKGTVYIVDDDEAVRDSLQWLLEGKDYRVKCFDSAESFLSRFDPREVACLIADIRMDGMTGLELQDRLIERKSPLPIVFITGHGDVPMAVTTMKKGAEDFIEKPFKEDEIVALVDRMLERARVAFSQHQEAASRPADHPRGAGAGAHRRRPAEQADRRRPGHQHQDGGGAPRQHHGEAERQHGGRPAEDRAGGAVQGLTAALPARPLSGGLFVAGAALGRPFCFSGSGASDPCLHN
jgi:CheY-like chemotaxis protein